jgi:tRNA threonylcarbamoyladenosine biosynthesis protein TsaE
VTGPVRAVLVGADEMRAFGIRLGRLLRAGDWVALVGELGSGKTTLVSGIVEGIHPGLRGRSPTYVLVEIYGASPAVVHADLYRLRSPAEAETLALPDLAEEDSVVLIEWADRAPDQLPPDRLDLALRYAGEDAREIIATPRGAAWEERLSGILADGTAARPGDRP